MERSSIESRKDPAVMELLGNLGIRRQEACFIKDSGKIFEAKIGKMTGTLKLRKGLGVPFHIFSGFIIEHPFYFLISSFP